MSGGPARAANPAETARPAAGLTAFRVRASGPRDDAKMNELEAHDIANYAPKPPPTSAA